MIIVSASVLGCNLAQLQQEIERVEVAGVQQIHFDVMDGIFVPNISFGLPVLSSIKKFTKAEIDVHLMIEEPLKYAERFADAGADIITFHVESKSNIADTIDIIKKNGKKAGLSVRPNTDIEEVLPYLDKLDNVLIMTVEPGFGGQSFMNEMMGKVKKIRKIINDNRFKCTIQVDGGIDEITAPVVIEAGADNLVSGSYIFNAVDIAVAVKKLKG